jgi:hypothetical protein
VKVRRSTEVRRSSPVRSPPWTSDPGGIETGNGPCLEPNAAASHVRMCCPTIFITLTYVHSFQNSRFKVAGHSPTWACMPLHLASMACGLAEVTWLRATAWTVRHGTIQVGPDPLIQVKSVSQTNIYILKHLHTLCQLRTAIYSSLLHNQRRVPSLSRSWSPLTSHQPHVVPPLRPHSMQPHSARRTAQRSPPPVADDQRVMVGSSIQDSRPVGSDEWISTLCHSLD